jgi:hypothetical protein
MIVLWILLFIASAPLLSCIAGICRASFWIGYIAAEEKLRGLYMKHLSPDKAMFR